MYRYEVQQRQQISNARGRGSERKGGRNCGTYTIDVWKQRAVTNDVGLAKSFLNDGDPDWRVFDHETNQPL